MWRIFYDSLLCQIDSLNNIVGYTIKLNNRDFLAPKLPTHNNLSISNMAFVDDTVWIANSRRHLQLIFTTANQFFNMCDIQINTAKTDIINLNPNPNNNTPLLLGNSNNPLIPHDKGVAIKYLGILFSADGTHQAQINQIISEVNSTNQILKRKFITEKQASYIINRVLFPAIEYRSQLFIISKSLCSKLMTTLRKTVKMKANLSIDTPNYIIHHSAFNNLNNIWEIQAQQKISELFYRINNNDISTYTTLCRLSQLQHDRWSHISVLTNPTAEPTPLGHNLIGSILPIMHELKISFSSDFKINSDSKIFGHKRSLESLIGTWPIYKKCRKILHDDNVLFLSQITKYNNKQIITWRQYKKRHRSNAYGKKPFWFKLIENQITNNYPLIPNNLWTTPNKIYQTPLYNMSNHFNSSNDQIIKWNQLSSRLITYQPTQFYSDRSIQHAGTSLVTAGSA